MALLRQTPQTLVIGRVPHQPALPNQCSKNRWTESNGSAPAGDADEVSASPRQDVSPGLVDRFRFARWLSDQLRCPHGGRWRSSGLCSDAKEVHLVGGLTRPRFPFPYQTLFLCHDSCPAQVR